MRFIASIPKIVVALLLVAAIINLLIGVFLRYVMIPVTDYMDWDPVRFTWVEEVGEMMLAQVLEPLRNTPWLVLMCTAFITMMFGMVLEGLPAAVVLIPVVFPIAEKMGIDPIHFNILQTAAVGIGLFLPPMGVGLLMALKFANLTVGQHWKTYMPYVAALMIGLILIILFPQLSLFLPKSAGLIK